MKKKWIGILMMLCLLGTVSACGKKEETAENTENSVSETLAVQEGDDFSLKDYDVESYVKLGDYKGLNVNVSGAAVTDADLDNMTDEFYMTLLSYVTGVEAEGQITDRAVENGDIVNIDYEGKKDGVAFSGGTAQGAYLAIGSGTFIAGFEEGLIGVMPGDTVDLNLTFPENYGASDLAGAAVVFTVKVNYILPEGHDDALIAAAGISGVTDDASLREYVSNYNRDQISNAVLNAFVSSCEFSDLPEDLVDRYRNIVKQNIEETATLYGMDGDSYISAVYGISLDDFLKDAGETVKENIALQAVANVEKLNIDDDELNSILLEQANLSGYDTVEEFVGAAGLEDYREYLMTERVTDFLIDNAVIDNK